MQNPKSATNSCLRWIHIPTPGDHYSPITGSAVMTVVYELARAHRDNGGQTSILVTQGSAEGFVPYGVGDLSEHRVSYHLPTRNQKIIDVVLGRVTLSRPHTSLPYLQLTESLSRNFGGHIFVHNQPAAIVGLRRRFPYAHVYLYAHNELFGTYSARESSRVLGCLNGVICVSEFLAAKIRSKVPNKSEKVYVAHNGVDSSLFLPASNSSRLSVEPLTLLFVGRMIPEKGPDILVKAARVLSERGLDFRLKLVGSNNFSADSELTPYELDLRSLACEIKDKIEFQSFVNRNHIAEIYRSADIFVAPSNWDEPFGLTVAEALSSGLACILSKRGGIPEVAQSAALYFDPLDMNCLVSHLERLLRDGKARLELGRAARERALQLNWENAYHQIVTALGGRSS